MTNRTRETGDVGYRAYKKNFLINGDMSVWARGTSIGVGGSDVYTADRWGAIAGGANITVSENVDSGNHYMIVAGAVGNTLSQVFQRIEAENSKFMYGDTTASLRLYHSESATVTWTAYAADTPDAFSAKTVIASGTFDTVASYVKYEFTFDTSSSTFYNGVEIRFDFGALPAGAVVGLRDVQLESGTSATEIEYVSPQQNLAECQRYYCDLGVVLGGFRNSVAAAINSSSAYGSEITFPVPMRRVPTVVIIEANWSGITLTGTTTTDNRTMQSYRPRSVDSSGMVAGNSYLISIKSTADAELY